LYPQLAEIANRWNESLGIAPTFPRDHRSYLKRCHDAGQTKPTPLLLRYGSGDYNCLHQDLYGEHVFPLQATVLLSQPNRDFTGGEFVLTEQRPRMQSRAEVVPLRQGDSVIFPVHHRPMRGTRGTYRVNMRHGVSRLHSGHRHTLGSFSTMRNEIEPLSARQRDQLRPYRHARRVWGAYPQGEGVAAWPRYQSRIFSPSQATTPSWPRMSSNACWT
jgi:Oxygenase, catalysing oxidative methylation of damaged DNA